MPNDYDLYQCYIFFDFFHIVLIYQSHLFLELKHIFLFQIHYYQINLLFLNYSHHKTFWNSIIGDDGKLQITEITIYIWIRAFPIIALADLWFDKKVSSEVWYSLDIIFFTLILGDVGSKYIKNKKDEKPTS